MPSSHGARPESARGGTVEPSHLLDDSPLPERYDVDECVAIPVDPRTLYVYWEIREKTIEYVRVTRPARDHRASARRHRPHVGRSPLEHHRPRGRRNPRRLFRPRSPGWVRRARRHRLEARRRLSAHRSLPRPRDPARRTVASRRRRARSRWTPTGSLPLQPADRDAISIERALSRVRQDAARVWRGQEVVPVDGQDHGGSSERWVNAPS